MIDLHTHILPGIDDGAEDEEVSAKLLDVLVSQGVSKIVFTSHYYGRKRSPRQYLEARAAAFAQIKNLIPADVEIFLGAEVYFTKQMAAANDSLCSLAIGDTRYILLELPFNAPWDRGLWNRLGDFISDTDYIPVIAHVERYKEVWKKPVLLSVLKDMGCLLQVNTGAFLDGDSKKLALALLGHHLVDCLGTDAHNLDARAPDYAAAKRAIEEAGFGENFAGIQENMRLVLENKPVPREKTKPVKKFLGRYY